jgi:phosphatidate cytidylyltransferase
VDCRAAAGALLSGSAAFWRNSKVLRLIFGILTIVPFFWGMLALRAWHYR